MVVGLFKLTGSLSSRKSKTVGFLSSRNSKTVVLFALGVVPIQDLQAVRLELKGL